MSFPWSGPAGNGLAAPVLSLHGLAVQNLSAAAMGALLLASAGKHFRDPGFYRDVVPGYLCRRDPEPGADQSAGANHSLAILSRDEWIAVSGLLELAAAVGILLPPTRKLTATALTAMFTAFLAGHVDAPVRAYGPQGTPGRRKIHTIRLPLQAPLILWAWSLRKPVQRAPQPGGVG
ncbi:DoxX family protein [Arthrobacter sp. Soil764]|uniref:DoxX family protein n=1 Tax=Arthrobacter sp. Soil764 TaxID=1736403 RepID=UPI000A59FB3F